MQLNQSRSCFQETGDTKTRWRGAPTSVIRESSPGCPLYFRPKYVNRRKNRPVRVTLIHDPPDERARPWRSRGANGSQAPCWVKTQWPQLSHSGALMTSQPSRLQMQKHFFDWALQNKTAINKIPNLLLFQLPEAKRDGSATETLPRCLEANESAHTEQGAASDEPPSQRKYVDDMHVILSRAAMVTVGCLSFANVSRNLMGALRVVPGSAEHGVTQLLVENVQAVIHSWPFAPDQLSLHREAAIWNLDFSGSHGCEKNC